MGIKEQIDEIEAEILKTQYNKATEYHIGKLKAKLARLRGDLEKQKEQGKGGGGKSYQVKKSGHATVAIVGFPSVGKSTILNILTGAKSATAAYQFTTLTIFPGILEYKGAKIQILDMPGLIEGAARGKGRGREVIAAARNADLILLCLDVFNLHVEVLERELDEAGFRLNTKPPDIALAKKERGGISVAFTGKQTHLDEKAVQGIVGAYGYISADVVIRQDITADQLVDFLTGSKKYIRTVMVLNKTDLATKAELDAAMKALAPWNPIPISAVKEINLDIMKQRIYETLGFIRVYLKPQNQPPDMKEPLVLLDGSTIASVCDHLHRQFRQHFRYAQVWGKSAKFPGQTVGMAHKLRDQDIVTIIIRR